MVSLDSEPPMISIDTFNVKIVRVLKGLEDIISLSIVHPHMGEKGWSFNGAQYEGQGAPASGEIGNIIQNPYKHDFLRDLYFLAQKDYDGRFTVPVLWDLEKKTIVNNEVGLL